MFSVTANYDSTSRGHFMKGLKKRTPGEREFHQAVSEVAEYVIPYVKEFRPELNDAIVFERLTEPNRTFIFRIIWEDDAGNVRLNRGFRVQHSNALGPYKGGLRFHPSVNLSILKFLAFEQTFKNALTGLQLGAAKGGSDFNPRGKSDREILRFCKSFMLELFNQIGPNLDVPAGDIGVGEREIGYLFGQYKRITGEFVPGVLTGKSLSFGGSEIRREATGYGAAFFAEQALETKNDSLKNKKCVISGSGNVALYCAQKIVQLGGKVLTLSDSDGFVYDPDGIDLEKLDYVIDLKTVKRGRIREYAEKYSGATYKAGKKPWAVKADLAFPCATQNEISLTDAKNLLAAGCQMVVEGANMPVAGDALHLLNERLTLAPGKAANAGGVAISGLEMSQNSQRESWSEEDMESNLHKIIANIHSQCVLYGKDPKSSKINYVKGANIAGFVRVADSMMAYGV